MSKSRLFKFFGATLIIIFAFRIWIDFSQIDFKIFPKFLQLVAICCLMLLVSNVFRTLRTKVILDQAKKGSWLVEFGILSIGSLTNFVIPFRAGEIVRAYLLSQYLRVSFLYTILTVVLERILDVFVISLLIFTCSNFSNFFNSEIHIFSAIALSLSTSMIIGFILLVYENRIIIKILRKLSEYTSLNLEWKIKHSLWTVIHGYQKFFKNSFNLIIYFIYLAITWFIYISAILLIWNNFLPDSNQINFQLLLSPFIVPDSVFGNQYYAQYELSLTNHFMGFNGYEIAFIEHFVSYSWLLLNIPIAIVGFISVIVGFTYSPSAQNVQTSNRRLDRTDTPNEKLSQFVESFFDKQTIAKQLHQEDVNGHIQLLGFFKGGSAAVTALIMKNDSFHVRKIVNKSNQEKLRNQYLWLRKYDHVSGIAAPIDEQEFDQTYSYDLEYFQKSTSFFDYIHSKPLSDSISKLNEILTLLRCSVYEETNIIVDQKLFEVYVQERFIDRVSDATKNSQLLKRVVKSDFIIYNGVQLLGLYPAVESILHDELSMENLSKFQISQAIHGDLTIDNILISEQGNAVLIDPSDDNQIRGPVIDFSRLLQSLDGGYEILNSNSAQPDITFDESGIPNIEYVDLKSVQYTKLSEYVKKDLFKLLLPEEVVALDFHVGLLFGRMLSHRVLIEEQTSVIYFVRCLEFLNKFISENNIQIRGTN